MKYKIVRCFFLLQLLGIALLVGGCLLKFGDDIIELNSNIKDTLAEVVLDGLEQSVAGILDNIIIICIVAGAVIVIVSFLGCLGACCQWKIALIVVSELFFF